MVNKLNSGFDKIDSYINTDEYIVSPVTFRRLPNGAVVLVNLAGEYCVLTDESFQNFIKKDLKKTSDAYRTLLSKQIIVEKYALDTLEFLNVKVQNKISSVADFTGLHIFVATLRCDHSCQYCQVSRKNSGSGNYDMSIDHANKALEWVFRSPNQNIKIEFQGGESLLNFDLIKHVVEKAKNINQKEKRNLQFVIATNLVFLSDEILDFTKSNNVQFSTSLDGPKELHNSNRPRPGGDSYELTVNGISRIRKHLGYDYVSALMTTTHRSLNHPIEIVNSYVEHGFDGLFLRPLSPFGFAKKTKLFYKYSQEDWLRFYDSVLDYIIELNKKGVQFQEYYTSMILRKMLTPYGTGYVDLQNPSGSALGAIVFNYDGKIFASDEGRMLAETGDSRLKLGHLNTDSYESVFGGEKLIEMLSSTMIENSPMCSDCAFQSWCGVDIAHHLATQSDYIGQKAISGFCKRHIGLFERIIMRMQSDSFTENLFNQWAWR